MNPKWWLSLIHILAINIAIDARKTAPPVDSLPPLPIGSLSPPIYGQYAPLDSSLYRLFAPWLSGVIYDRMDGLWFQAGGMTPGSTQVFSLANHFYSLATAAAAAETVALCRGSRLRVRYALGDRLILEREVLGFTRTVRMTNNFLGE